MVKLEEFIKRVNGLEAYLKKQAPDVLLKHENQIVDLSNKQLLAGFNTLDKVMQKGYSLQYGKRRQKKGLQTSFVDLKFSGKYQDTKKLVKYDYGVDIRSAADYEAYLRGNFPEHVGLNKKNADIISEVIAGEIAVLTKKYLVE